MRTVTSMIQEEGVDLLRNHYVKVPLVAASVAIAVLCFGYWLETRVLGNSIEKMQKAPEKKASKKEEKKKKQSN